MLEPDAESAAVFIDKFYAGIFEGALNLPNGISKSIRSVFEAAYGICCDTSIYRQVTDPPTKGGPRHSDLHRIDHWDNVPNRLYNVLTRVE